MQIYMFILFCQDLIVVNVKVQNENMSLLLVHLVETSVVLSKMHWLNECLSRKTVHTSTKHLVRL